MKHMTLGEMKERLENFNSEAKIIYDFGGYVPSEPDSYRGYYEQLAFGIEDSNSYTSLPNVGDVLKWINEALDGKVFVGYKGGNYKMTADTPVWASNYGNNSHTAIVNIKRLMVDEFQNDSLVVICTCHEDIMNDEY